MARARRLWSLTRREFERLRWRGNLIMPLCFGVGAAVSGTVFLRDKEFADPQALTDSLSSLNMLIMLIGFGAVSLTMVAVASDMKKIRDEYQNDAIPSSWQVLARFFSRLPAIALIGLIAGIGYWWGTKNDDTDSLTMLGQYIMIFIDYGISCCALGVLVSVATQSVVSVVYVVVGVLVALAIASEVPVRTSGTAFGWLSYVLPSGYTGGYLGSLTEVAAILESRNDVSARNRLWDGGDWQVVDLLGNLGLAAAYLVAAWGILKFRLTRPARV